MNQNRKPSTLWTKDYILLLTANFFLFFAESLFLPVLPVYVKQSGADDVQVGVVVAVFFITSILTRFFTASAAARFGRHRILLAGMVIFTLTMCGYYLLSGLAPIIVLRLIQGIGFGAASTLYGSTVAGIVPDEKMGEGMGYLGLGVSVAYVLGPCLGAAAISLPNYKWIFLAAALLALVSILMTHFIAAGRAEDAAPAPETPAVSVSDMMEPNVLYESSFIFLLGLFMSSCDTYVVLYARQLKISNIFLYFAATTAAEVGTRLFAGKLYDKKGMNVVVIPGAAAGLASCFAAWLTRDLTALCVFALLFGTAIGLIFPGSEANAMKKVSAERRIAANATFYNMLDIGSGLGPLCFGAVAQSHGYAGTFLLSGVVFLVMLLLPPAKLLLRRRSRAAHAGPDR